MAGESAARAGKPPFYWLILIVGAAAAAAQVLSAVWIVRYGPVRKSPGWRASYDNGGWIVARVDPGGPAAGLLEPGDRLLALDVDTRAAFLGPGFKLREIRAGGAYEIRVERRGEERVSLLRLAAIPRTGAEIGYLVSLLALSFAFLATSLVIGILRPEDPIARWGSASLYVSSLTLLASAYSPLVASMSPADTTLAFLIPLPNPVHLAVAFGFYSRFPAGIARGRIAAAAGRLFFALGAALWVSEELARRVLAQTALPAGAFLEARLPRLLAFDSLDAPFSLAAFAAICAVIARRMRRVVEPDQRRRMRWIAYGSLAGLSPWLLYEALALAFLDPLEPSPWLIAANRIANLALAIVPVVTGYAIVKHRLFDINVVVRRGLQYLLARNVLTAATALGSVAFGVTVYQSRNRTLADILLHRTGYFYLSAAGAALLAVRRPLREWLDRRFFREAYDRETILAGLARDIGKLDTFTEVSRHVSRELEAALHPASIHVFRRESERSAQVLVYSSGEMSPPAPPLRIADDAVLLQLMEHEDRPRDFPLPEGELPRAERDWLEALGVSLVVPMCGRSRRLVGLLLLGERRSEEPYGPSDRKLLAAIAGRMALRCESTSP